MKKIVKFAAVACATFALSVPAMADEEAAAEANNGAAVEEAPAGDPEVVGWSPLAIGIASPVQLPWGRARWDVYGLDLNLFYTEAPTIYGIGFGGLASVARDNVAGVLISGLFNFVADDTYGAEVSLISNLNRGKTYGFSADCIGMATDFYGLKADLVGGGVKNKMYGWQLAGVANACGGSVWGAQTALIANIAPDMHGLQAALVFNMAGTLNGAQIGLVNFTDDCQAGFQIGLVNIIMSNVLKVCPIANGYF